MKRRLFDALLCCVLALCSALAGAEDELSGTYVLVQRTTTVADVPLLPDVSAETRSVALLALSRQGARLRGAGPLCHIEIVSSSALVRTELPAALKQVLPRVELDARLEPHADGYRLRQPPRSIVLGAQLRDLVRDPLPTSASDRRVFDQDGDGHPGVTVRVRGIASGELYIVQRATSLLDGTGRDGRFYGQVRFSSEDIVLGATRRILTLRTNTRPDLARSTFRLERLPRGTTCRELMARASWW